MLIDSNIVIYSVLPEHSFLDAWLDRPDTAFSIVTKIEVLGFANLSDAQRDYFEKLFVSAATLPLNEMVSQECIRLRRNHKIKLADSVIAATAIVHNLPLVTRNVADFAGIPGLQIVDPFSHGSGASSSLRQP